MSQRASLLGPLSGVGCVLLAAVAINVDGTAQAECITQLTRVAPEGTHWSLHTDQVTNRRCWILVEGPRREGAPPAAQEQEPSFSSQFTTFLGSFTGGAFSPSQETSAAAPASPAPHKPPAHVANTNVASTGAASTNKLEHPVRTEQKADGQAGKRELADPVEREALFEEFLRWHESQQLTGGATSPPR